MPTAKPSALDVAEQAARKAREAFAMTGIKVPMIAGQASMGNSSVDLGVTDAETATRLAEWIRKHATGEACSS